MEAFGLVISGEHGTDRISCIGVAWDSSNGRTWNHDELLHLSLCDKPFYKRFRISSKATQVTNCGGKLLFSGFMITTCAHDQCRARLWLLVSIHTLPTPLLLNSPHHTVISAHASPSGTWSLLDSISLL